jgi:hypothetical protein
MLPLPIGQLDAISSAWWWKPACGPSRLWRHSPTLTAESGPSTESDTFAWLVTLACGNISTPFSCAPVSTLQD